MLKKIFWYCSFGFIGSGVDDEICLICVVFICCDFFLGFDILLGKEVVIVVFM